MTTEVVQSNHASMIMADVNMKQTCEITHDQIRKIKETVSSSLKEITGLKERNECFQMDLDSAVKKNETLEKYSQELNVKLKDRDSQIRYQERYLNDLEQYTRRNSIRIYDIEDKSKDEDIEVTSNLVISPLNSKLKMNLVARDIDISHRIGKFSHDTNRPIICKFVNRIIKRRVLRARRQLRATAIVLKEDLTLRNAKLLEAVSAKEEVENAWSDDGKILVLLLNGKKLRFELNSDLEKQLIPKDELRRIQSERKINR